MSCEGSLWSPLDPRESLLFIVWVADRDEIALWGLYRAGFRVVAFIHDEVLIELPVESDLTASALRVDRILCESMEQLTGSVPIACEYALSDRWYKAAEAIFDEKGRLCLWNPKK